MKKSDPNAVISSTGPMRLQRALAAAGLGSRRSCEELITDGRVEIDRETVTQLGVKVDPQSQEIRVDGQRVTISRRHYYAVNKPSGVVSTNYDQQGRMRVVDMIRSDLRLFPVGRLDRTSQGLILVTNDGDVAHKLTHPRFEIEKTYLCVVAGHPKWEELKPLLDGVHLAEGFAKVAELKIKKRMKSGTQLQIVLKEGRNREIRRLLAKIGHKVLHLQRIAMGPIQLGGLPEGESRLLTFEEVKLLEATLERAGRAAKSRPRKKTANTGHASRNKLRNSREQSYQESGAARKKKSSSGPLSKKRRSPRKGKSGPKSARPSAGRGKKSSPPRRRGRG
jgi:23S rRNA pseudouridine2605 synthase